MFPSSGYFKGVNCPFYSSGLCERPYCHFRHTKIKDSLPVPHGDSSKEVHNGNQQPRKSSLLNLVGNAIKQVQQEIQQDQQKLYGSQHRKRTSSTNCTYIPTKRDSSAESNLNPKIDWYKPSPVSPSGKVEYHPTKKEDLNKYTGKQLSVPQQKKQYVALSSGSQSGGYVPSKKSKVPEYNPTPIKQLQHMSQCGSPELEYDPSTNYEYSNKKTVSPGGTKRNLNFDVTEINSKRFKSDICIDGDLQEFENIEAKFSDDDEDDHGDEKSSEQKEHKSPDDIKGDAKDAKDLNEKKSRLQNAAQEVPVNNTEETPKNSKSENETSGTINEENVKPEEVQQHEDVDTVGGDKSENAERNGDSLNCQVEDLKPVVKLENPIEDLDKKAAASQNDSSNSKQRDQKSSHHSHSHRSSGHASDHKHSRHSHSSSSHKHSQSSHRHSSSKEKSEKSSSSKSSSSKSKNSSGSSSKHSESHKDKSRKDKSDDTKVKSSSSSSSSKSSSKKHHSSDHNKTSGTSSHHSSDSKSQSGSCSKDKMDKGSELSKSKSHSADKKRKSSSDSKTSKDCSSEAKSSKHSKSRTVSTDSSKIILFGSDSEDDLSLSDVSVSEITSVGEDKTSETNRQHKHEVKQKVDNTFDQNDQANSEDEDDADFVDVPDVYDIDLSDEDPYDECLKIYNEASKADNQKTDGDRKSMLTQASIIKKREEKLKIENPLGKKRVAHQAGLERSNHAKESAKPYYRPSPAQVMHNRFLQLQKQAEEAAASTSATAAKSVSDSQVKPTGKRVAHCAAGSNLLQNKRPKSTPKKTESASTCISTNPKGAKRVARVPTKVTCKRPTIPSEYGSKVPVNVRQRYLNLIIDECLKIYDTEKDAYERGLEEEKAVYKRSSNRTVYLNVAVNAVKRLRSEVTLHQPGTSSQTPDKHPKGFSHEAVLGGSRAAKTSFTLNRSGGPVVLNEKDFTDAGLYKKLTPYIMTEEQLVDNGFPRFNPECAGTPFIKLREDSMSKLFSKIENERICCRCGKRFPVYPNGMYGKQEECNYHWGKAWKKRIAGAIETRYTCCQGDLGAAGCQVAKLHVHEQNKYENNSGFMRTIPCSPPVDGDYGVYALDCEMVYTTAGIELARVTVIGGDMKPAYETLVKPEKPVIDCNTRFSGLKKEDLKGVRTTIRDVQAVLLSLFSDKTILMGHSLESDLISLKLIHSTVVDTSVVFPHKMGPPYKRALKTLMVEYMQKIIQDDVGGHDSKEDAMACLELMLWKVKDDAKKHR
ncbi:RNA exonuclease 1 homolog isoform X2 [Lingula anatina]|uniref:RNA exonuclease 1 homolog isoform X2 n=1 Tax=Lingula anatina TaxID=7574 RepID=A0A1S3K3L0_LINAN|nr:RNA exonuclease 1 homolog isoform X2 [Lingula anatina]|eukprot:XP_013417107.1 RNA exonuclease 1 homolog isoform X2 [Lingula anatina]